MSKKTKSKEVKPSNEWWCETCNPKAVMTHTEAMQHLRDAHGLEPKGLKCKKQMLMHVDGDTWFTFQWSVIVKSKKGDIHMTNSTMSPRDKDDMMRYA